LFTFLAGQAFVGDDGAEAESENAEEAEADDDDCPQRAGGNQADPRGPRSIGSARSTCSSTTPATPAGR